MAHAKTGDTVHVHYTGKLDDGTVRITELTDASVTLDGNHPLAGEDLTFDLQLAGIV